MEHLSKRDKELLKALDDEYKSNDELQIAIQTYLSEHGLFLSENVKYEPVIDGVHVLINNDVVLRIGLPPVSNYPVRETEYTDKYLREKNSVAI